MASVLRDELEHAESIHCIYANLFSFQITFQITFLPLFAQS